MKPELPRFAPGASPRERAGEMWKYRKALEAYWQLRPTSTKPQRGLPLSPRARVATAVLRMVGLAGRGWRNACRPVLRELTLSVDGLPDALRGFRILHLSDLHYPPGAHDYEQAVRDLVAGQTVDLCALTGDFRFGRRMSPELAMPPLERLLAAIEPRLGTFAVLGNHDLSDMVPHLRAMGLKLLVNEGTRVDTGGDGIWVAGVDDPHMYRCAVPEAAMDGAPDEAFKLFLAHAPEAYDGAARMGAQLYLCGHTHGGQVRLPHFGALYANAHCPRAYADGLWRHEGMQGFTSRGLGVTEVPVRFRCPPEAAIMTLWPAGIS